MQNPLILLTVLVVVVCVITIIKLLQNKNKTRVFFNYSVHVQQKGHPMALDVSITNEEKVQVTLTPVTESGQPALLDGAPVWTVSVDGGSTVVPAADGLSAFLVSGDAPGDTTFVITADADLGTGVVNVSDTITLHVAGAMAKHLGITVGTPVLK